MISHKYLTCGFAVGALAVVGCANAEGEFKTFQGRYHDVHNATASSSSSGTGGAGGGSNVCMNMVPEAGKADGNFIFAFAASLDPKNPVLFDAKLTTLKGASGLEFKIRVQALLAKDRKTPVGNPIDLGPFPVKADTSFDADFPPLDVVGAANPISGSDITADAEILGKMCAPANFVCGDLKGLVTKPAEIDLTGSTFAMERLDAPGAFPAQPKINCKGDLAKPLK